jgi:hypothetical protein
VGWWALLAVVSFALGRGNLLATGLLFAGGGAACYWLSLHRHPFRVCRACKGTGRHRGTMFRWSHRACTKCGGSLRHRRWGVELLHNNPADKQTWAERIAKKAGKRRGAPR